MNKELIFKKPQKNPDGYTLLTTGAKRIKFWKPSLFKRFAYWTGIMKDPRYDGKKMVINKATDEGLISSNDG